MTLQGIDILYEDAPCLVVNKPGGLLTQAPPGIDSLEVRIKRYLDSRHDAPYPPYLGLPHRLDRPVSGAILFATTKGATRKLAKQFERREVTKTYWALVEGHLDSPRGTWTDSLRKIPGEARSEVVPAEHAEARSAVLHYEVLGHHEQGDWLQIELETGRTHQIRVQTASRGHAILGDELYGATTSFGPPTEDHRMRWIALHARTLSFLHPQSRELTTIEAPLPVAWSTSGRFAESANR